MGDTLQPFMDWRGVDKEVDDLSLIVWTEWMGWHDNSFSLLGYGHFHETSEFSGNFTFKMYKYLTLDKECIYGYVCIQYKYIDTHTSLL